MACALVAFFGASLGMVAPAWAQDLAEGRRLYGEADFRGARAVLEAVLSSPSAEREELAEAHALLSSLHHMMGERRASASHAARALALAPETSAPDGAAEELVALFGEIRARRGARPASLRFDVDPSPAVGRSSRVTLELRDAPAGLVAALSLRCTSGAEVAVGSGGPPSLDVRAVPRAEELRCRGQGSSAAGATLLDSTLELAVETAEELERPEQPLEPREHDDLDTGRPTGPGEPERPLSPWVWVGVGSGAALLVAAAVVLTVALWPTEAIIDETLVRW
jgi:hypothetical protein